MKKIMLILAIVLGLVISSTAQRARVRMNFPVHISIGAPGPAPFYGAIWIGPEWRWHRGHYTCVPGYWARPQRHRAAWSGGYWKESRRGYVWVPGRWRY
jgi:hypothetical protein